VLVVAYERDFTILPIVTSSRSLLGYLDVPALQSDDRVSPTAPVSSRMRKFARHRPYTSPCTPFRL
jgi:hypothetical protein